MDRIDNIKQKCPKFLSTLDHLEYDEGWDFLVEKACTTIEYYISTQLCNLPDDERDIYAVQIKEKFGGLRIYYNQSDKFVDGVIFLAELLSQSTCESCGSTGSLRNLGYVKTLCDSCFSNRKNRK